MNRILAATKLDFYTLKTSVRTVAIAFVVPIILSIVEKASTFAPALVLLLATFVGSTVFQIYEKNHAEELFGTLPLRKSEMIAGRYLYALLVALIAFVFALIMAVVTTRISGAALDWFSLWASVSIGFLYYCFAVGVAYPLYIKFTFSKVYIFTMLPMYLLGVLGFALMRSSNIMANINSVVTFFQKNQVLLPVCGLLGGIVLLVISALIANAVFTRREQ